MPKMANILLFTPVQIAVELSRPQTELDLLRRIFNLESDAT